MKTHSIEWTNSYEAGNTISPIPVKRVNNALQLAAKAFRALVPALAIVVGAAWLVTVPDLVVYLQAALWTSGFVFMGLALDVDKRGSGLSLLTGIALPVLTLLSSRVAVEIAIIATALVAAWIAAAIWRR
jgi:hypothetical protein